MHFSIPAVRTPAHLARRAMHEFDELRADIQERPGKNFELALGALIKCDERTLGFPEVGWRRAEVRQEVP